MILMNDGTILIVNIALKSFPLFKYGKLRRMVDDAYITLHLGACYRNSFHPAVK